MDCAFFILDNVIQNYAWGSRSAIASLLGRDVPTAAPEAELWIGAHPKAPSRIVEPAGRGTLAEAIRREPETMLGRFAATRFANELPFLFKVLAAAEPLSIQSHPSLEQARAGFLRENLAGIPVDAPHRNYRDANHKPELVAPLTPFVALEGFRPMEQIRAAFALLALPALEPSLAAAHGPASLRHFFETLMHLDAAARSAILDKAALLASSRPDESAWVWVARLLEKYPGDIGALAPLYLNLVFLSPGEALYLPAGELHAYLEGTALEIMANSDNVLRGGLTPKHVDVPELVSTLTFRSGPPEILRAQPSASGVSTYRTPAPEFELSLVDTFPGAPATLAGPCILLGLDGEAEAQAGERRVRIIKGRTVFVPACLGAVGVSGRSRIARAGIPGAA